MAASPPARPRRLAYGQVDVEHRTDHQGQGKACHESWDVKPAMVCHLGGSVGPQNAGTFPVPLTGATSRCKLDRHPRTVGGLFIAIAWRAPASGGRLVKNVIGRLPHHFGLCRRVVASCKGRSTSRRGNWSTSPPNYLNAATRAACSAMTRALSRSGVPATSPLNITLGLDHIGKRGQPPQLSL